MKKKVVHAKVGPLPLRSARGITLSACVKRCSVSRRYSLAWMVLRLWSRPRRIAAVSASACAEGIMRKRGRRWQLLFPAHSRPGALADSSDMVIDDNFTFTLFLRKLSM